jgi:hypothetical protein
MNGSCGGNYHLFEHMHDAERINLTGTGCAGKISIDTVVPNVLFLVPFASAALWRPLVGRGSQGV